MGLDGRSLRIYDGLMTKYGDLDLPK
jgi:hypothetical protein